MRVRPLVFIALLALTACRSETPTADTSASDASVTTAGSVTQETVSTSDTLLSEPDVAPASIEIVAGKQAGYIDYTWSGTDDSRSMNVHLVNRTERVWTVDIEVGTTLDPLDGIAQSMVVTEETHVKIDSHSSQTVEVEAACLDISKDTPGPSDTTWQVSPSPQLAAFINCIKQSDKDSVQAAVWHFRGATRQQWVDYFTKYGDKTSAEAEEEADSVRNDIDALVDSCRP